MGFASTIASPATANTKQECSVQCVSIRWSVRVFKRSACFLSDFQPPWSAVVSSTHSCKSDAFRFLSTDHPNCSSNAYSLNLGRNQRCHIHIGRGFSEESLSSNKGLCGVPSLPTCPIFWENGRLSKTGKIAIGVSSTFLFCALLAVIYICCIRRRRNDYDFGLPSELMSLAAKRNRYQRQKSLMLLEMESQHAKGLSPFTPLN
ncbi:unnamed protein product [Citrullus colocynthis]|uniref:Uncharacterized protein n=1 Tax=Citrullus colocynthis TaxID=252529 RepID=A0ABP0Z6Q3_9ROSI